MAGFVTTINVAGLLKRLDAAKTAKTKFANKVMQDCNVYCPVDTGALKGSAHVQGESQIVWDTDYAVYPYNMDDGSTNWTRSNVHSHWCEYAKQEKLDEWKRFAAEELGGTALM